MKQLIACMKKEWIEAVRRKRVFLFLGIAVGMAILTVIMLYAITGIMEAMGGSTEMGMMFSKSVSTSVWFYSSFMQTYYLLIAVILLSGTVAKEVKQKKWVLPVCSGVKPSNMAAAKFIVLPAVTAGSAVIGYVFNAILGAALFSHDLSAARVVLSGLGIAVTVLFYSVFTVSMSSLTKSSLFSALVPLIFLFVFQYIFQALKISNYTPFLFASLISSSPGTNLPTAAEWGTGVSVTAVILAAFIGFGVANKRLGIV